MFQFLKHLFINSYGSHFFWDLYEAQKSPDHKAMTMLFEQYN